jgi:hypothetical protein
VRIRGAQPLMECIITSRRHGWMPLGYEVRLFSRTQLVYRSRVFLTRKLANDEADALLIDLLRSFGGDNTHPPALTMQSRDTDATKRRDVAHAPQEESAAI